MLQCKPFDWSGIRELPSARKVTSQQKLIDRFSDASARIGRVEQSNKKRAPVKYGWHRFGDSKGDKQLRTRSGTARLDLKDNSILSGMTTSLHPGVGRRHLANKNRADHHSGSVLSLLLQESRQALTANALIMMEVAHVGYFVKVVPNIYLRPAVTARTSVFIRLSRNGAIVWQISLRVRLFPRHGIAGEGEHCSSGTISITQMLTFQQPL